MKKVQIYLSSTKYNWWNLKSYNWKKNIKKEFKKCCYNLKKPHFIDPLVFETENPTICAKDIDDINSSDYIIVYIDKVTIGTMMELCYCLHNKKNYRILTFNKKVYTHPWIVGMCGDNVYTTYMDCVNSIHDDYISKLNKHFYKHKKYGKNNKKDRRRKNRTK